MKALARQLGVRYSYDRTEAAVAVMLGKLDKLKKVRKEEAPTVLPETALERYLFPTSYWTDPMGKGGRGFTDEMVELFDLGYDPMEECAIIPIRDMYGRLLGFTRRFLDPTSPIKYKDPRGFQKGHHLFGSWLASHHESGTVVLTEGPLDAIKVWQAGFVGIAQYGSYLTEEQIRLLRRMGVVRVILMYDNDRGGKLATHYAMGFTTDKDGVRHYEPEHDVRKFALVKVASYKTITSKDPGSMSDQEIVRSIGAARSLM
jgi:5S rRNA maturation endonuclease (ribonuclease M5)